MAAAAPVVGSRPGAGLEPHADADRVPGQHCTARQGRQGDRADCVRDGFHVGSPGLTREINIPPGNSFPEIAGSNESAPRHGPSGGGPSPAGCRLGTVPRRLMSASAASAIRAVATVSGSVLVIFRARVYNARAPGKAGFERGRCGRRALGAKVDSRRMRSRQDGGMSGVRSGGRADGRRGWWESSSSALTAAPSSRSWGWTRRARRGPRYRGGLGAVRIGFLHSLIRKEEKLLLGELAKHGGVEVVMLDDRKMVFDLKSGRRVDVVLERCINHSRALHGLRAAREPGDPVREQLRGRNICGDKLLTSLALEEAGVAQPAVRIAFTEASALDALDDLGYPAVLSPPSFLGPVALQGQRPRRGGVDPGAQDHPRQLPPFHLLHPGVRREGRGATSAASWWGTSASPRSTAIPHTGSRTPRAARKRRTAR